MAKKYDYSDINFCKRIVLRKDVQGLNRVMSGIAKDTIYFREHQVILMEKFLGTLRQSQIKNYMSEKSPIDSFGYETLSMLADYLSAVKYLWSKTELENRNSKKYYQIVEESAKKVRDNAKRYGSLPESLPTEPRLPYVEDYMYNKALSTLQQNNVLEFMQRNFINKHKEYTTKPSNLENKKDKKVEMEKEKAQVTTIAKPKAVKATNGTPKKVSRPKIAEKMTTIEYIRYIKVKLSETYEKKDQIIEKITIAEEQEDECRYELKIMPTPMGRAHMYAQMISHKEEKELLVQKLTKLDKKSSKLEKELEVQRKIYQKETADEQSKEQTK